jgi:hypothetical protein
MTTFSFSKDGIFRKNSNSTTFERYMYTNEDIAVSYIPSLYGLTIPNGYLTYEMLDIITTMVNNGWDLLPSFYTLVDENGKNKLIPSFSNFMLWYDNNGEVVQYFCRINYRTMLTELFNHNEKIAEFISVDNMFKCMPHLTETEPLILKQYINNRVSKNIREFDRRGFDNEIYLRDNLVYEDMDLHDCLFSLDRKKCHEVKIECSE